MCDSREDSGSESLHDDISDDFTTNRTKRPTLPFTDVTLEGLVNVKRIVVVVIASSQFENELYLLSKLI